MLALLAERPAAKGLGIDISEEALAVARDNAAGLGLAGRVALLRSDWSAVLGESTFDLVVSNPPYIASADHHLAALKYEPLQALASGVDGLDDIRSIIHRAPKHLLPGGWLLLEHGYDQAATVRALLTNAGLHNAQSRRDLAGIERCSGAQRP